MTGKRIIHSPRGPELSCKGWHQEAALRMLMNNLDPDVAEAPDRLVVYGGGGGGGGGGAGYRRGGGGVGGAGGGEKMVVPAREHVWRFKTHEGGARAVIGQFD